MIWLNLFTDQANRKIIGQKINTVLKFDSFSYYRRVREV